METVAVIDFETTGLSPAMGDRATEVAVVIVEGGRILDRWKPNFYALHAFSAPGQVAIMGC